ncbi:hypothetical protein ILUMI_22736 [Ignelater luminosus]|uniref:Transmembrane protein 192 n=1 Tax=Ignelater luminosus TaxID=2038154 RepID=A0A8K0G2B5_IGNLU|nr:hypothetical protein ILUMI_22736 [Ignelater luminosus]
MEGTVMDENEDSQLDLKPYVYKPLKTVVPLIVIMSVMLVFTIIAAVFCLINLVPSTRCRVHYILIYFNVVLWFLILPTESALKFQFLELHKNGYVEFYRENHPLLEVPTYTVGWGNTMFLLTESIWQFVYPDSFEKRCRCGSSNLGVIGYLASFILLEFFAIVGFGLTHIGNAWIFHKLKSPPDDQVEQSFLQSQIEEIEELIEEQADMIEQLTEDNARLSEKLRMLEMSPRSSN